MHNKDMPQQSARKDVFHAFMVENADFDGDYEIPCVKTAPMIPSRLIPFSKAISEKDYSGFVVFYEQDERFEALWNHPNRYLQILKRFDGVITPDYSLYCDMPLAMQIWNTYRGKAIGAWLNDNGVSTIPNVRWSDERTYDLACLGIEKNSVIAIGSHGCIKCPESRRMFFKGFEQIIRKLMPKTIIIYGTVPKELSLLAALYKAELVSYESNFSLSHKKGVS